MLISRFVTGKRGTEIMWYGTQVLAKYPLQVKLTALLFLVSI